MSARGPRHSRLPHTTGRCLSVTGVIVIARHRTPGVQSSRHACDAPLMTCRRLALMSPTAGISDGEIKASQHAAPCNLPSASHRQLLTWSRSALSTGRYISIIVPVDRGWVGAPEDGRGVMRDGTLAAEIWWWQLMPCLWSANETIRILAAGGEYWIQHPVSGQWTRRRKHRWPTITQLNPTGNYGRRCQAPPSLHPYKLSNVPNYSMWLSISVLICLRFQSGQR